MTSPAEPLRPIHSMVRSRNGKISLPLVRRPAIFRKNSGFFSKIFAFLHSEDAEMLQPSSAPFNDNRELIMKYYLKIHCYNFSDHLPPLQKNFSQMRPI